MLSPHDELLHFFNHEITRDFLEPAYKRGQYVLLHVYCTGHGYMDKRSSQSQILLNMPIYLHNATTYHNPFPIEEILHEVFSKYTNTSIVFLADICREENNYHGVALNGFADADKAIKDHRSKFLSQLKENGPKGKDGNPFKAPGELLKYY
jgi:hypothetical protein